MSLTSVVAGVVQLQDGTVLIARRSEHKPLAGHWEFPGGKVKTHEDDKSALRREIWEELSIEIQVEDLIGIASDDYFQLRVYWCRAESLPLSSSDHDRISAVKLPELRGYNFCPLDRPIVKKIVEES